MRVMRDEDNRALPKERNKGKELQKDWVYSLERSASVTIFSHHNDHIPHILYHRIVACYNNIMINDRSNSPEVLLCIDHTV